MAKRIKFIQQSDVYMPEMNRYGLQAFREDNPEFGDLNFIGTFKHTDFIIRCQDYLNQTNNSPCQMYYVTHPNNQHITLYFYGKYLADWHTINTMALGKLKTWLQAAQS